MSEAWTVSRLVAFLTEDLTSRGMDSPRLDAELLVAHALSVERMQLYLSPERPVDDDERTALRVLLTRRRRGEPMAYILGDREFWGRRFAVGPAVLIPRPDSETLIERALALLGPDATGPVLDVATGSGALGLTLAAERPHLEVDLADLSADALSVARANAEALDVAGPRLRLLHGDLFAPVDRTYALVVCNPPYIPSAEVDELPVDIRDFEPRLALDGGADGFSVHDRLVAQLPEVLVEGGVALIEVGAGQAPDLAARFDRQPWVAKTARHTDLGGHERVVEVRRHGPDAFAASSREAEAPRKTLQAGGDGEPLIGAPPPFDTEVPRVVDAETPAPAVQLRVETWTTPAGDPVEVVRGDGPRAADGVLLPALLREMQTRLAAEALLVAVPHAGHIAAVDGLQDESRLAMFASRMQEARADAGDAGLSRLLFAVRDGELVAVAG